MRLLVIIKNAPSPSPTKRHRSKRSARLTNTARPSRKVILMNPSAARKMSSPAELPAVVPGWLLAPLAASPFVSAPPAPHNTSDFLMRLHADRSSSVAVSSSFSDAAATACPAETAMGTGTSSISSSPSSTSSLSCDSFDGLDTFGSNFGLINADLLKSFHDIFRQHQSPALPSSTSSGLCHSQLNNAVEAR